MKLCGWEEVRKNGVAGGRSGRVDWIDRAEVVRTLSMSKADLPIACDLNALTPEERDRRQMVLGAVARTIIGRGELANGFELSFDAEILPRSANGSLWNGGAVHFCTFASISNRQAKLR